MTRSVSRPSASMRSSRGWSVCDNKFKTMPMISFCIKRITSLGRARAILSYGASARTARHAMKQLRAKGEKVNLFTAQTLWPFPEAAVEELANSVERIIVPEMNLGQLALEVERVAGRKKVVRVNRANGEMVTPDMIVSAVEA